MPEARTTSPPQQDWLNALAQARADVASGRVHDVDVEALCAEIEAEATEIDPKLRQGRDSSAA